MSRLPSAFALTCVLAAPLPWLAETHLREQVHAGISRCDDGSEVCGTLGAVELDAGGLRLRELAVTRRGMHASMTRAHVHPSWSGIDVWLHDLRLAPAPSSTPSPSPAIADAETDQAQASGALRIPTHGFAVRVRTTGLTELTRAGVTARIDAPSLDIDAEGRPRASFGLSVQHARGFARSEGRLRAAPSTQGWTLTGALVLGDGPPLRLQALASREQVRAELRHEAGGWLLATGSPRHSNADLEAHDFPLHGLGRLATLDAGGAQLSLGDARIDGRLEVHRGDATDDPLVVHLDDWTVRGGSLSHPKLSSTPIVFGELSLDGEVSLVDATRFDAQLSMSHDGLDLGAAFSRRPERAAVTLELPRTPCQSLFSALPHGFADTLRGAKVEGSLEAGLELVVDFAAAEARAKLLEADPMAEPAAPGRLDVRFPFREQCTVLSDPAAIDFAALRKNYRHHFVDADGRSRSRTLAPGAEGFVSLSRVPLIAGAFVGLEDTRYFKHEGLDLEQIENALWHNLAHGEVERGASTITQQAARNLFLGLDRSAARKLQEAFIATRLDATVSKRRLLEVYLNIIEFAPGVHGVEDAAMFYFGEHAEDLSPLQATHLAMLAPAPRTYAKRFANGQVDDAWRAELRGHLRRLTRHHVLTKAQLHGALRGGLRLLDRTQGA